MAQELLRVEHLSAAYGGIHALHDISLKVEEGEIVGVLGANGAGKSTLLKCLSSEKKFLNGSITFDGKPLPSKPYQVVENGMVIVPEGRQIFYKLSVKDNLKVGCCLRNDKDGIRKDFERVYAMFPRLKERENQYGGLLSGGEQQMLAIARGLMAKPRLLMLDEPGLGLAPIIVNQIMDILKEVNEEGTTILLIEHDMKLVSGICEKLTMLNFGEVLAEGATSEVLNNPQVITAYLGE